MIKQILIANIKNARNISVLICCLIIPNVQSQIVAGNAYMIGEYVEVGIDGEAGHEGAIDWPGNHSRGGVTDVKYGFVANPQINDWATFDGDFFTSGTPENGFGMEINGRNYSNNAWNHLTLVTHLQQIPKRPGTSITHTKVDSCITVEWEGKVAGVAINIKYHLIIDQVTFDGPEYDPLYYTTEITITNESGSDIEDFYYYRNLDADNNEALSRNFNTKNTIVAQPDEDCLKALVSAEQTTPWDSYVGIGSYGENFRVSHGGFSNRSGSDIWNGTGLNSDVGDIQTGDFAISLAYKEALLSAGETINFTYSIVLDESKVDASLSSLYYIEYDSYFGAGGEVNCLEYLTLDGCYGNLMQFNITGPGVDDYSWEWNVDYDNDTSWLMPQHPVTYPFDWVTVEGTPLTECLTTPIKKAIKVFPYGGFLLVIEDPGPICDEFSLDTFVVYDDYGSEHMECVYLTEEPDSAWQMEPAFDGPVVYPGDEVWMLCRDTVTGCYAYELLEFYFIIDNAAGRDSSIEVCSGLGAIYDLHMLLQPDDNNKGRYEEITSSGRFNDSTGVLNAITLEGTFEFLYILDGVGHCAGDTAHYIVTVLPAPDALFEFEVGGLSSNDGLLDACINDTIYFTNLSTIADPQYIESFEWDFGDGTFSDELHPRKIFDEPGLKLFVLKVISNAGCEDNYSYMVNIFDVPEITTIIADPQCYGFTNGSIEVTTDVNIDLFRIVISDEDRNILSDGPNLLEGLGPGTYYIDLYNRGGCNQSDTVTLYGPVELDILLHYANPPCLGDSGYVVIDSVTNKSLNNPISYHWDPNPAGIEGLDADSSYWMKAGDYTVTVTDSKGCIQTADITLVDPPLFYFTEWGSDTAYCRLYNYQSGNGSVYAAAAGGRPNYIYEWTYDYDGTTSNNSTWGGRNPGEHTIRITDAGGCILTKTVYVDSVNPIASFTMQSTDLNDDCEGTAPVAVEFTNTSQYFSNPNNPLADTTFFWDLDRSIEEDWMISHDYFEKFDTMYQELGESYHINACLIAMNKNGCRDTVCKTVTIFEPPVFTPINVFTPNGGGENDHFTFEHFAKGIDEFNCIIVNRWGVQVAEISDIRGQWDGLDYKGEMCTDGVYFYTYIAIADNGDKFEGQGNVTIVSSGRE